MSAPAIIVEGIGKVYQLTHRSAGTASFREAITSAVVAPFRRFRELRGTADSLESFWALKDVSFNAAAGQVLGVVGRNGAGKSTLLKILSRITEPTEGRAVMRGRVASLLEVGTGFHPELTGRENIFLNGSVLGMKRREITAKFSDIVAFAEIEKFLDTPVKRYSSGMYVRLAFAVAAHLEPEILIVDEVLAVGDAEFQKRCLGKMKEISQGGGRTVLFVSHNLAAVRSLCSHGLLLSGGRVALQGSASVVADAYEAPQFERREASRRFTSPASARVSMHTATLLVNGEEGIDVPMGARLQLAVSFRALQPLRHPRLGFVLQSANGEKILNANNRYQPSPAFETPASGGTIVCDLGVVPLMPGRYVFSLWLGDMAQDHHVELEALAFEVIGRDLWSQGQMPPAGTLMYWPTMFTLEADAHAIDFGETSGDKRSK